MRRVASVRAPAPHRGLAEVKVKLLAPYGTLADRRGGLSATAYRQLHRARARARSPERSKCPSCASPGPHGAPAATAVTARAHGDGDDAPLARAPADGACAPALRLACWPARPAAPAGAGRRRAVPWRLEPVLPPHEPRPARNEHPDRPRQDRRHRVLGAEPWPADHRRQPADDPARRVGLRRVGWHELADVCGATDGRIAWAGADEFWTVSDGRPGAGGNDGPSRRSRTTRCASSGPGRRRSSAPMGRSPSGRTPTSRCTAPPASARPTAGSAATSCPQGQVGAFHLHWDGGSLTAVPNPQGHAVSGDAPGSATASSRACGSPAKTDRHRTESATEPSVLHPIAPNGVSPTFASLHRRNPDRAAAADPRGREFPTALDFFHLTADEHALWGAANPVSPPPAGSAPGEVTILHQAGGVWSQVLGAGTDPPRRQPVHQIHEQRTRRPEPARHVDRRRTREPKRPGSRSTPNPTANIASPVARATVARISADGTISDEQTLPSPQKKKRVSVPRAAPNASPARPRTTAGWRRRRAGSSTSLTKRTVTSPADSDPAFAGLITFRPPDQGVPPVVPDAPPVDDSGLPGEQPAGAVLEPPPASTEGGSPSPCCRTSKVRVLHGTTLELSFHLAVKARVRLLAKRRKRVVGRPGC